MYIPGKVGAIVGILLIWGGYAITTVICTTIAGKVGKWMKNRDKEQNK